MLELIISPLAVALSLSTSFGVFIHETKVDKLTASFSIVSPAAVAHHASALLEGMPHTHIERGSINTTSGELRTQVPSTTPRRDQDEKYRLEKKVPRGYHLFDSYFLPLESIQ